MKPNRKEQLIVELIDAFHWLKKKLFESLKSSFGNEKLSYIHWRILCILQRSEGVRPGELSKELGLSRSAVSQYLNGLLKRKLVAIEVDGQDRRLRNIKLTPKGDSFLKNFRKKTHQTFELLFANLDEEEIETLLKIFRKIIS